MDTPEQKAAELAFGLGIALYVDEQGRITQRGPGKRIEPPPNAKPVPHEVDMSKST